MEGIDLLAKVFFLSHGQNEIHHLAMLLTICWHISAARRVVLFIYLLFIYLFIVYLFLANEQKACLAPGKK